MKRSTTAWMWAAVLLGCGAAIIARAEPSPPGAKHAGHGTTAAGVASLDVYLDRAGRLHLLTAERASAGDKPRLAYAHSGDGGATWSAAVPVGEGQPMPDPVKRGNDAQIVAAGERVLAVWTVGADTKMGRGPLEAAVSNDGGQTWSPAPGPSDAEGIVDHAFTDLAADEQGNFHAVWLDNRRAKSPAGLPVDSPSDSPIDSPTDLPTDSSTDSPIDSAVRSSAHLPASAPAKALRYARSTDAGRSWSANVTLDPACCECCWNSLLTLPGGNVCVLYRDKDPRDMALMRSADAGETWGKPVTVGAFDWAFTGCPHVGGAIASSGEDGRDLCAVVWTAKGGGDVGVFALASSDGGVNWKSPTQLGGPQSTRPDVAADTGRVVAVWDTYVDDGKSASGNAIFAAISTDAGKTWSTPARLSAAGASATHPRIVARSGAFRAFWTQQERGKPVEWKSRRIDSVTAASARGR